MGYTVEARVYRVSELEKYLNEHAKPDVLRLSPKGLLEKIMPKFGTQQGESFILLHDDHADENDSWFNFQDFVERYYEWKKEISLGHGYMMLSAAECSSAGNSDTSDEVAEELKLILKEEEE